ncbi:MAG: hypothetical protein SynsKO_00510 [Synoicihabitans sp.]
MSTGELVYREGAEFDIPADLKHVEPALRAMQQYLDVRGFPESEWAGLQLATAEALNNAISHGCANHPNETVLLRWTWLDSGLAIQVRDPSQFTPPADWGELPEDPLAESGRGGFLITSYFDQVTHSLSDRGHQLELHKQIDARPEAPNKAAVEHELTLMTQDLSDSYESLAALFQISSLLATSSSFDEFLRSVLERLRRLLSSDIVYARIKTENSDWMTRHDADDSSASPPDELTSHEEKVWAARQFVSHDDAEKLPPDEPLRQWQAGLTVGPIGFQNTSVGLIGAGRRAGNPFTAGQNNLMRTVADFVGVAYTTAQLHRHREEQMREHREVEIAAQIQESLLPKTFPQKTRWNIHGVCQSARTVGGDFFDIIETPDGTIMVLIADSMGKGVPAAMFASLLRASARACITVTNDPGELLTELNRLIADDLSNLGMFITAAIVALRPDGRTIEIANAGHPAPIAFDKVGGRAIEIESGGDVPLGVINDTRYHSVRGQLDVGQVACLITDGLFEIDDLEGNMLGLTSLMNKLPGWWTGDLQTFTRGCLTHLSLLEHGQPSDDQTLVAFNSQLR